jgi:hypothetical protein
MTHPRYLAAKITIRDRSGKAHLVELDGFAVTLDSLPGWEFHARLDMDGSWLFSEVRTGAKFPPVMNAASLEEAVQRVDAFCRNNGKEECERVFQKVLDKFGDLTRPQ